MNNTPQRIKLTVAYDGTAYHGWQYQPNIPTIEGELKHSLFELFNEDISIIGLSRTDTGVHALCNIAVFDIKTMIPAEKISYALNRHLPPDIRIQKSEAVAADFHPRRINSRKTYEYRILNADFPIPTARLYHHFVYQQLDVQKMQKGASYLIGEHDFASFHTAGADVKSTVRTIYEADVNLRQFENRLENTSGVLPVEIIISLNGNGFLYNMVRIIAGTLIEIGLSKYPPEKVIEILAEKKRAAAGPTAPAIGLTLTKVFLDTHGHV